MTDSSVRRWHISPWPPLAWLETAVKGVAQLIGIAVLFSAIGDHFRRPTGTRLAEVTLLAVLSLGLLAAIADRIADREIVAMAFVVPNIIAHWGVVIGLLTVPGPDGPVSAFFALMLLGEIVKLVFLRTSGFRVRDVSPRVVGALTIVYGLGYGILLALQLGN